MAEKRLIDANNVEFALQGICNRESGIPLAVGEWLANIVRNAQTVDAVEVCRCRDCIHRHNGKDCTNPLLLSYSWGAIRNVKDDDFCSYGERRTDG